MLPDTINALGMILMVVFTAAIVLIFRTNPIKNVAWKKRIPLAIGGAVSTLFYWVYAVPIKRCIEIPEPFGQFKITAVCVFFLILLVNRRTILLASCVLVLYSGAQLQIQFDDLVHNSVDYYTIDANTNKIMAKGCSENESPVGIVLEKLWHTWFTGIYKVKKLGDLTSA